MNKQCSQCPDPSNQQPYVDSSASSTLPLTVVRRTGQLLSIATRSFGAALARTHRLREQRAKLIDRALEEIEH